MRGPAGRGVGCQRGGRESNDKSGRIARIGQVSRRRGTRRSIAVCQRQRKGLAEDSLCRAKKKKKKKEKKKKYDITLLMTRNWACRQGHSGRAGGPAVVRIAGPVRLSDIHSRRNLPEEPSSSIIDDRDKSAVPGGGVEGASRQDARRNRGRENRRDRGRSAGLDGPALPEVTLLGYRL